MKTVISYFKSLKFRIFVLLIVFGIAPGFLLRAGILSAYESRAVETRTVDIHINTLRRKIDDDGTKIQTIRGVGYKIG